MMTRERIIDCLRSALDGHAAVHAVWLEGADATGTVDEHSDIDLVVDVDDQQEDAIHALVRDTADELGALDYVSTVSSPAPGLSHQVLHIGGTPRAWLIDVVVQSHSRKFVFTRGHPSEMAAVLFDRSGVVRHKEVDASELSARVRTRADLLVTDFSPMSRIARYIDRGQFLEALAAYRKYLLEPLVEILRLRHSPLAHDYGLVHISRHLPADVVEPLEALHTVSTLNEIADGTVAGEAWFWATVRALRKD